MRHTLIFAALAGALFVSACANTVRGVGRDVGNTVDATGAAVRDVAE
ncbi:entericidin domain-containing protein [Jiella marina]